MVVRRAAGVAMYSSPVNNWSKNCVDVRVWDMDRVWDNGQSVEKVIRDRVTDQ